MAIIDQSLDTEIEISGFEWKVSNMSVKRSRYNQTNTVTMMATPDPEDNPDAVPVEGAEAVIRLGPRTSFVSGEGRSAFDSGGELWTVFSGYVSNTFEMEEGLYEIDIVDFTIDLKKYEFYYNTDSETYISTIVGELVTRVNASLDSTIEPELETVIDLEQSVGSQLEGAYFALEQTGEDTNIDIPISVSYTGKSAAEVLDELAKMANANWWIDAFNRLHFGQTETKIHKLDWVTETSAGKKTPPYRSVRVIGDGVSSEQGWDAKNLISKDGTVSERQVEDTVQDYGGYNQPLLEEIGISEQQLAAESQELKTPVFTYKNKSIKTLEQAQNIANKLVDELQEQQAGGSITIVGRPMVDSLDIVEMPDRFGRTSTGTVVEPAQYLVTAVEHRLTQSEGYVTKIECGGLAGRYDGPVFEYGDSGSLILSSKDTVEVER